MQVQRNFDKNVSGRCAFGADSVLVWHSNTNSEHIFTYLSQQVTFSFQMANEGILWLPCQRPIAAPMGQSSGI